MKKSVIDRLRHAQRWFSENGPQWAWMYELSRDAAEELETQSGALWCQWATRGGHIRIFVAGEMGIREIDSLMQYLELSRSYMREDQAESVAAVARTVEEG